MTESGQLCGQRHTWWYPATPCTSDVGAWGFPHPCSHLPDSWCTSCRSVCDCEDQAYWREGGGFSNWDKLVTILFLFVIQQVNCCRRVCLVQLLVKFLNALIHFGAWRFTLIPVIHRHRHKCFPITPTAWMGVLDTLDSIQVKIDVRQMGLIDGSMSRNPWGDHRGLDWPLPCWRGFRTFISIQHIAFHLCRHRHWSLATSCLPCRCLVLTVCTIAHRGNGRDPVYNPLETLRALAVACPSGGISHLNRPPLS
jgi:hypothetical protein